MDTDTKFKEKFKQLQRYRPYLLELMEKNRGNDGIFQKLKKMYGTITGEFRCNKLHNLIKVEERILKWKKMDNRRTNTERQQKSITQKEASTSQSTEKRKSSEEKIIEIINLDSSDDDDIEIVSYTAPNSKPVLIIEDNKPALIESKDELQCPKLEFSDVEDIESNESSENKIEINRTLEFTNKEKDNPICSKNYQDKLTLNANVIRRRDSIFIEIKLGGRQNANGEKENCAITDKIYAVDNETNNFIKLRDEVISDNSTKDYKPKVLSAESETCDINKNNICSSVVNASNNISSKQDKFPEVTENFTNKSEEPQTNYIKNNQNKINTDVNEFENISSNSEEETSEKSKTELNRNLKNENEFENISSSEEEIFSSLRLKELQESVNNKNQSKDTKEMNEFEDVTSSEEEMFQKNDNEGEEKINETKDIKTTVGEIQKNLLPNSEKIHKSNQNKTFENDTKFAIIVDIKKDLASVVTENENQETESRHKDKYLGILQNIDNTENDVQSKLKDQILEITNEIHHSVIEKCNEEETSENKSTEQNTSKDKRTNEEIIESRKDCEKGSIGLYCSLNESIKNAQQTKMNSEKFIMSSPISQDFLSSENSKVSKNVNDSVLDSKLESDKEEHISEKNGRTNNVSDNEALFLSDSETEDYIKGLNIEFELSYCQQEKNDNKVITKIIQNSENSISKQSSQSKLSHAMHVSDVRLEKGKVHISSENSIIKAESLMDKRNNSKQIEKSYEVNKPQITNEDEGDINEERNIQEGKISTNHELETSKISNGKKITILEDIRLTKNLCVGPNLMACLSSTNNISADKEINTVFVPAAKLEIFKTTPEKLINPIKDKTVEDFSLEGIHAKQIESKTPSELESLNLSGNILLLDQEKANPRCNQSLFPCFSFLSKSIFDLEPGKDKIPVDEGERAPFDYCTTIEKQDPNDDKPLFERRPERKESGKLVLDLDDCLKILKSSYINDIIEQNKSVFMEFLTTSENITTSPKSQVNAPKNSLLDEWSNKSLNELHEFRFQLEKKMGVDLGAILKFGQNESPGNIHESEPIISMDDIELELDDIIKNIQETPQSVLPSSSYNLPLEISMQKDTENITQVLRLPPEIKVNDPRLRNRLALLYDKTNQVDSLAESPQKKHQIPAVNDILGFEDQKIQREIHSTGIKEIGPTPTLSSTSSYHSPTTLNQSKPITYGEYKRLKQAALDARNARRKAVEAANRAFKLELEEDRKKMEKEKRKTAEIKTEAIQKKTVDQANKVQKIKLKAEREIPKQNIIKTHKEELKKIVSHDSSKLHQGKMEEGLEPKKISNTEINRRKSVIVTSNQAKLKSNVQNQKNHRTELEEQSKKQKILKIEISKASDLAIGIPRRKSIVENPKKDQKIRSDSNREKQSTSSKKSINNVRKTHCDKLEKKETPKTVKIEKKRVKDDKLETGVVRGKTVSVDSRSDNEKALETRREKQKNLSTEDNMHKTANLEIRVIRRKSSVRTSNKVQKLKLEPEVEMQKDHNAKKDMINSSGLGKDVQNAHTKSKKQKQQVLSSDGHKVKATKLEAETCSRKCTIEAAKKFDQALEMEKENHDIFETEEILKSSDFEDNIIVPIATRKRRLMVLSSSEDEISNTPKRSNVNKKLKKKKIKFNLIEKHKTEVATKSETKDFEENSELSKENLKYHASALETIKVRKRNKNCISNREIVALHRDLQEMFIRDDVLMAMGRRRSSIRGQQRILDLYNKENSEIKEENLKSQEESENSQEQSGSEKDQYECKGGKSGIEEEEVESEEEESEIEKEECESEKDEDISKIPKSFYSDEDAETVDFDEYIAKKREEEIIKRNSPIVLLKKLSTDNWEIANQLKEEDLLKPVKAVPFKALSDRRRSEFSKTHSKMEIKNTNPAWHYKDTEFSSHCLICFKKFAELVSHYVISHPHSEIFIARLPKSDIKYLEEHPGRATRLHQKNKFTVECFFCQYTMEGRFDKFCHHYATHTGEFPYECSICDFMSCNKSDMVKHTKTECEKGAKSRKYYTYDKNAIKINLYICTKCNYMQLHKANIEFHLQYEHNLSLISQTDIKELILLELENDQNIEIVNEPIQKVSTRDDEIQVRSDITSRNYEDSDSDTVMSDISIDIKPDTFLTNSSMDQITNESTEIDQEMVELTKNPSKLTVGLERKSANLLNNPTLIDNTMTVIHYSKSLGINEKISDVNELSPDESFIQDTTDKSSEVHATDTITSNSITRKHFERALPVKIEYKTEHGNSDEQNVDQYNIKDISISFENQEVTEEIEQPVENEDNSYGSNCAPAENQEQCQEMIVENLVMDQPIRNDSISNNSHDSIAENQGFSGTMEITNEKEELPKVNSTSEKVSREQHGLFRIENFGYQEIRDDEYIFHCLIENCNFGVTISYEVLKEHINAEHDIKWSGKCNICIDKLGLLPDSQPVEEELNHMLSVHINELQELQDDDDENKVLSLLKPWLSETKSNKTKKLSEAMLSETLLCCLYKCMGDDCSFISESKVRMSQHLATHELKILGKVYNSKSWLECCYCDHYADKTLRVLEHIDNVHSSSLFQCTRCFYRSRSLANVATHQNQHHSNNNDKNKTIICNGKSKNLMLDIDRINKLRTDNIKAISCLVCSQKYFRRDLMRKHYKDAHKQSGIPKDLSMDLLSCLFCNFEHDKLEETRIHMANKHPEEELYIGVREIVNGNCEEDICGIAYIENTQNDTVEDQTQGIYAQYQLENSSPSGDQTIGQSNLTDLTNSAGQTVSDSVQNFKSKLMSINDIEELWNPKETPNNCNANPNEQMFNLYDNSSVSLCQELLQSLQCFIKSYIPCFICNKKINLEQHWTNHFRTVHSSLNEFTVLNCPHCPNKFSFLTYPEHFINHHCTLLATYFCYYCCRDYDDQIKATEHLMSHADHKSAKCMYIKVNNSVGDTPNNDEKYQVAIIVPTEFDNNIVDVVKHMIKISEERKQKESQSNCLTMIDLTTDYNENIDINYPMYVPASKRFICSFCDNIWIDEMSFESHMKRNHCTIWSFKCPHCSVVLNYNPTTYDIIKDHYGLHSEVVFMCYVCKLYTSNGIILINHIAKHSQQNVPIVCYYRNENEVRYHYEVVNFAPLAKSMSPNNKIQCIFCEMFMDTYENLNEHLQRVHSILRYYVCNYCPFRGIEEKVDSHIFNVHRNSNPDMFRFCSKEIYRKIIICNRKPSNLIKPCCSKDITIEEHHLHSKRKLNHISSEPENSQGNEKRRMLESSIIEQNRENKIGEASAYVSDNSIQVQTVTTTIMHQTPSSKWTNKTPSASLGNLLVNQNSLEQLPKQLVSVVPIERLREPSGTHKKNDSNPKRRRKTGVELLKFTCFHCFYQCKSYNQLCEHWKKMICSAKLNTSYKFYVSNNELSSFFSHSMVEKIIKMAKKKSECYQCPDCNEIYFTQNFCLNHMKKKNDISKQFFCTYNQETILYGCEECSVFYISEEDAVKHIAKHTFRFGCLICSNSYRSQNELYAHYIHVHHRAETNYKYLVRNTKNMYIYQNMLVVFTCGLVLTKYDLRATVFGMESEYIKLIDRIVENV